MKRKISKMLFSFAAIFCLLSISVTSVYTTTSEVSNVDNSVPAFIFSLVIFLFVLILVVGILLLKLTKTGGYGVSPQNHEKADIRHTLPGRTKQIVGIIKQNAPKFSEVKFKSFAEYVYTTLKEEYCNCAISHIKLFLHDSLY